VSLLLNQEGADVCSVDLISREGDSRVVVGLRGELDVSVAVRIVAQLSVVAAREREIIVDLTGLEFIDSSGLAALVRVREQARRAGGDLLLAAPQRQVLRLLTLTRLVDVFSVHASVDEAATDAGRPQRAGATVSGPPTILATT
jgi:anti-sigma B factor antagonist